MRLEGRARVEEVGRAKQVVARLQGQAELADGGRASELPAWPALIGVHWRRLLWLQPQFQVRRPPTRHKHVNTQSAGVLVCKPSEFCHRPGSEGPTDKVRIGRLVDGWVVVPREEGDLQSAQLPQTVSTEEVEVLAQLPTAGCRLEQHGAVVYEVGGRGGPLATRQVWRQTGRGLGVRTGRGRGQEGTYAQHRIKGANLRSLGLDHRKELWQTSHGIAASDDPTRHCWWHRSWTRLRCCNGPARWRECLAAKLAKVLALDDGREGPATLVFAREGDQGIAVRVDGCDVADVPGRQPHGLLAVGREVLKDDDLLARL
mmetsp:Transcript_2215/g.5980  ORF Transcript_2215/g.5980 Transcript_2215/m.5980 type:complete len:316 (+) Transcript_2215:1015-1962(+)